MTLMAMAMIIVMLLAILMFQPMRVSEKTTVCGINGNSGGNAKC